MVVVGEMDEMTTRFGSHYTILCLARNPIGYEFSRFIQLDHNPSSERQLINVYWNIFGVFNIPDMNSHSDPTAASLNAFMCYRFVALDSLEKR